MLFENLRIAFTAIRANWLRTLLTLSIIAFGIMALVGILTSIEAMKASLTENFAGMGSNTFNIIRKGTGLRGGQRGQRPKVGTPISFDQALHFKEQFAFPAQVSISALGATAAAVQFSSKATNPNITVYGADEQYLKVAGYEIGLGRNISKAEAEEGRNVVLLGKVIVDNLFNGNGYAALGKIIYIRNIPYEVIGILKEKGSSMSFAGDRMVIIPLMTLRKYFGSQTNSYNLSVMVNDPTQLNLATSEAQGVFRRTRGLKVTEEADFEIEKSDNLISLVLDNTATIQLAAIFIGLVTLLGAAIGLMNIMLVSVTERTREIGICKSLGATRKNILAQFLIEAVAICQLGGILGVILGIMAGNGVSLIVGGDFIIPWAWMALGLTLCFIVGLISGLYPAVRAASLDPIEALRHE
jgi:putative ABC transport system permease protein